MANIYQKAKIRLNKDIQITKSLTLFKNSEHYVVSGEETDFAIDYYDCLYDVPFDCLTFLTEEDMTPDPVIGLFPKTDSEKIAWYDYWNKALVKENKELADKVSKSDQDKMERLTLENEKLIEENKRFKIELREKNTKISNQAEQINNILAKRKKWFG